MMESRETVLSRLPDSVRQRLGGGARSLDEALVCMNVAGVVAGPRAAMVVAIEAYRVPVQCEAEYTLEDVLWYVQERFPTDVLDTDMLVGSVNTNGRVRCRPVNKNPVMTYRSLVYRYSKILRGESRLPKVELKPGQNRFQSYSEGCWWYGRSKDTDVFPNKFGAKTVKINVRFDDLWEDVRSYYPEIAYVVAKDRLVLDGMYNDEACGWLVWMCATFCHLGPAAIALPRVYARQHGLLKHLNVYVKALGAQHKRWGALVCELVSLRGRGVERLRPETDILPRISEEEFYRTKAAAVDSARLRDCIRRVVRSEMVRKPIWQDRDSYWSRRWLYTKSGAHSRFREQELLGRKLDLPERPTRREFSEAVSENLVGFGEPRVDAGFSEKEEHGKTRAIYGCDTRSYFTFDYLLRPVEACWRNHRVLLDPGRKLQSQLYSEFARKSGARFMLDFDDFNSQHTIEAMKAVIEIATEGAPQDLRAWAIRSWDNMFVHWGQGDELKIAKMVGTLPSGHRATTFVNTVLNAAYCMYVAEDYFDELDSYHCGDDVVVFGGSVALSRFVADFQESVFRINPAKQSLGYATGEFLRVAFGKKNARGYAARGIASVVSGNWVTDNRLDQKSYTETLLRGCWTINTRCHTRNLGVLFRRSLTRNVPVLEGVATRLLRHEWSFNGTPVAAASTGDGVVVVRASGGIATLERPKLATTLATDAFMANHIDFKMLAATDYTPGQLKNMLVRASAKPRGVVGETPLTYVTERTNKWYQSDLDGVVRLISRVDKTSVEALNILQAMLTKVEWEKLAGKVRNVSLTGYGLTGKSPWPVIVPYTMPFSDAMALRQKLSCTTAIHIKYPVRV